jgi:glutamate racemase
MAADAGAPRAPIGVFDSGVGGLTVLRALREALPAQDFIYLGDTARLPYGTKSPETVVRYSLQCAGALIARGVSALVIACNTASASALPALTLRHPSLPAIGVIEPGAQAAVRASSSQHIAVIGTEGTIQGGAYQNAIHERSAGARVSARACSLFVALAEEGWTQGPVVEAVARRYLEPLFQQRDAPDTLVLGCTHFPVLIPALRAVLPAGVRIVDSAATTARAVVERLGLGARAPGEAAPRERSGAAAPGEGAARERTGAAAPGGRVVWLATDGAERFARVGGTFLGAPLEADSVEIVDL